MSEFTARKLRETRKKVGLSQDEAADRLNMSRRRLGYHGQDEGNR